MAVEATFPSSLMSRYPPCWILLPPFKEIIMPLISGKAAKSRKGFGENVKREMQAGKPQQQAVAIAYAQARKKKKKTKKKAKKK